MNAHKMHTVPQEQWKAQGEAAAYARAERKKLEDEFHEKLHARFGDKIKIIKMDLDCINYDTKELSSSELDEFAGMIHEHIYGSGEEFDTHKISARITNRIPHPLECAPATKSPMESLLPGVDRNRVFAHLYGSPAPESKSLEDAYRLLCLLREACRVSSETVSVLKGIGATPQDFTALEMLVFDAGARGIHV